MTATGPKGKQTESYRHGVRNKDTMDRFVKQFGKERFAKLVATDRHFRRFVEPEPPKGCGWLFNQFLYIYFNVKADGMTGTRQISFTDINEYQRCMKVPLTVAEKKLLIRMSHWAGEQISELENPPDEKEIKGRSPKEK